MKDAAAATAPQHPLDGARRRRVHVVLGAGAAALTLYWFGAATGWPVLLRGPVTGWGWNWPMLGQAHFAGATLMIVATLATVWLLAARSLASSPSSWRRWLALAALPIGCFILMIAFLAVKSERPFELLFVRAHNEGFFGHTRTGWEATWANLTSGFVAFNPRTCFHCHTHPPGTMLFCWLFMRAAEHLPSATLAPWLASMLNVRQPVLPPPYFFGLATSVLAILAIGALTPLVAYAIARRDVDRPTAYLVAAMTAALPSLVLMTPEFDQLETVPPLLAYYFALRSQDRNSRGYAAAAGLMLALGTYFTYFVACFGLPLALVWFSGRAGESLTVRPSAVNEVNESEEVPSPWRGRRGAELAALGLAAFVAFYVVLWLATGTNIIAAYRTSAAFHFTTVNEKRSYWRFLGFNLLDVAHFVGMPCVLAALAGLWQRHRTRLHVVAGVALILTIDVLGLQRGEAGRIWMFMMPLVVLGTMPLLLRARELGERRAAAGLFLLQMFGCGLLGLSWNVP